MPQIYCRKILAPKIYSKSLQVKVYRQKPAGKSLSAVSLVLMYKNYIHLQERRLKETKRKLK